MTNPRNRQPGEIIDIARRYMVLGAQVIKFLDSESPPAPDENADNGSHLFEAQRKQVVEWALSRHDAQSDAEHTVIDSAFEAEMQNEPDFINWLEYNIARMHAYLDDHTPKAANIYPSANQLN